MAQGEQDSQNDHVSDGSQQNGGDNNGKKGGKKRNPLVRVILIVLVIVVIIAWGAYWFLTRNEIDTDDAYTAGRKLAMAPHVNGYVTRLLVNDNQYVRAGQLLVKIDDRDYIAALHKAQAQLTQAQANLAGSRLAADVAKQNFPGRYITAQGNLAAAQAQLFKAETDYRRQHAVSRAATTQQDIDYAKAALDQAHAQVQQAEGQLQQAKPVIPNIQNTQQTVSQQEAALKAADAAVVQAQLNYDWTEVRAPHDGWISQRNVEQGNFVQTGQELFSIVEPEVWVVANYKETQITRMRVGQKVDIDVDAYPSLKLHGHIDSIQLGAGAAFSAFPPENATGNFVKIVQRVPVKIVIDSGLDPNVPLPLGVSVEPTVTVP
ncbi:multidrug ABC transporter [Neoasaia chiangmaiensis NBRC 101099]|uniref:Multidrug export protein EmrA n=1 Tax=Neoasaia chiangmaiensis TaxID=320497 RepID=A0A1U9KS43_9PROT|nr:HlyD family secretion protein [Neoasaia chiangmaiensis]AQS88653.1 multidrug export protein EmrA [Neoasaia chiangmaiensis]GBR41145.1 multidrug ABC transporter [Neoasaia chiangmaiensis NBRC 101099]GEN13593.1 multidrug export protein EmrA [Neoasaia chiangmaiensis]